MFGTNRFVGLVVTFLLSTAAWSSDPLKSEYSVDVDGDGRPDTFTYTLRTGKPHEASLRIQSASGAVLWEHSWIIQPDDLATLMEEDGRKDASEWVKRFFDNKNFDAGTYVRQKLTDRDLSEEYITFWAEQLKLSPATLKSHILSQKINHTFHYRAEWREDFYALVYVPQLKKFIQYTGYGEE
jgi:hypothetical protein